ncbi:MAG TPA: mycobacterial-type methylenetetrahydrofolate reductase [Patescibacteria group bacterium]|nr:mycobacterial-type methylenetetrahydrofolate reductase [Patescibacteria group bacterium]
MKKRKVNKSFAEKVKNGERTVLYELLPPPQKLSRKDIHNSFSLFANMLKDSSVDAVNIPEVREETRSGDRPDSVIVKLEPRTVCSYLRKYTPHELVINRPIVYAPWDLQKKWLHETYKKHGIHSLVLVGGESSSNTYPGLSVIDAAQAIHKLYPDIILGGITIPTRQREENRVLQKSNNGVTFFTTQILYESKPIKKFLRDYWRVCQQTETKPAMIFLSFAPITTIADLKLLEWLGVGLSKKTLNILTNGWLGMGWRSFQICQAILEDIVSFVERERIRVPLGLNVEHLNRHNLEASFVLLEKLSRVYTK